MQNSSVLEGFEKSACHHRSVCQGSGTKEVSLAGEELRESAEKAFHAYVRPLAMVPLFKFLGQVLTAADDNWLEVVGKL